MKIMVTGGEGYIGSVLSNYLEAFGHDIDRVDLVGPVRRDYRELDWSDLDGFDVVIHLAGHSSVKACADEPRPSLHNNLLGFIPFLETLSMRPNPPLVLWASSGSVLSDQKSLYDQTKRSLEFLVPMVYRRSIGLRFASVCGVSPAMRHDIILNAMVRSAVKSGYINVANPNIRKPILALSDLCLGVVRLLELDHNALDGHIVNMASFLTYPMTAATEIMRQTGAVVRRQPDSPSYDFDMYGDIPAVAQLKDLVEILVEHYRNAP